MSVTGLQWHDAALAVARDGSLVSIEPSVIHANPAQPELFGHPAIDVARRSPRSVSAEHWSIIAREGAQTPRSVIDVARAELARRVDTTQHLAPLQCAVSAAFDGALGTLLAIARLEGIAVGGLHDAAALAVAASGLQSTTLVLEVGLADVTVTRVEYLEGEARRRAAVVKRGIGMLALQQRWLRMIGEAMVLATRFDPLHDGVSEQRLYDLLDAAAATAAETGSCLIELPTTSESVRVEVGRDRFVEAAAEIFRSIAGAIHELRPAGQRVNLLFDEALLRLPGLLEQLAGLRACQLVTHSTGLVARAASLMSGEADENGAVTLQRGCRLPAPLESARRVDPGERMSLVTPPTHVLWDGRAVALPSRGALEIGRSPAADGIRLAEGLSGVSRLHCSLRTDEGQVTLVPYTAQATWLNDERVQGRVKVVSGDRLRLGSPGVTLELIAVGGLGDGAPPQR